MFKKLPVVVAVSALLLTACGQNSESAATAAPTAAAVTYPVTIENNGNSITLGTQPMNIISLSPTATEMLFAIGAGAQVVAVDDQSNFPADAPISDLSGFTPNLEAIVAKSPDLVVVSNDIDNIVSSLTAAAIPVLVEPAAVSLDDTYTQIQELGDAAGHPAESDALVESMKSDIANAISTLPESAKSLTYYHELDNTLYSITSATFIGSIYKLAGLTNIADSAVDASGGYPQLSPEFIVSADPNLIFLADIKCCSQNLAALAVRPGFASLAAVKNGTVVELDDDIASRWGPRTVDLVNAIVAGVNKATVK